MSYTYDLKKKHNSLADMATEEKDLLDFAKIRQNQDK